jgi:hypothetical protein
VAAELFAFRQPATGAAVAAAFAPPAPTRSRAGAKLGGERGSMRVSRRTTMPDRAASLRDLLAQSDASGAAVDKHPGPIAESDASGAAVDKHTGPGGADASADKR